MNREAAKHLFAQAIWYKLSKQNESEFLKLFERQDSSRDCVIPA